MRMVRGFLPHSRKRLMITLSQEFILTIKHQIAVVLIRLAVHYLLHHFQKIRCQLKKHQTILTVTMRIQMHNTLELIGRKMPAILLVSRLDQSAQITQAFVHQMKLVVIGIPTSMTQAAKFLAVLLRLRL